MFKKAILVSTLALFTTISFASIPTQVPCPGKKMIQESVDKVEFSVMPGSQRWKEFMVGSNTPAFSTEGRAWTVVTVIHANDKEDAITRGKNNLRHTFAKFNDFAEKKTPGDILMCMYFGKKGITMASTRETT